MSGWLIAPVRFVYRVTRALKGVDVTKLLHLPAGNEIEAFDRVDYEIRSVGGQEFQSLLRAERIASQAGEAEQIYDRRRALVAAFHGDRVISFAWLVRESIEGIDNFSRAVHLGTSINMPDGTAFVYNAWTDPEYRGRRLMSAILAWATRHRVCGACSLLTTVDWTNEKSIQAFRHLGMREVGLICRLGWGKAQISIAPVAARRQGFRVADDAPGLKLAW